MRSQTGLTEESNCLQTEDPEEPDDPGSDRDRDSRELEPEPERPSLEKRASSRAMQQRAKRSFADLFGMDVEEEEEGVFGSRQKFSFIDSHLLANKFTVLDTVHMHENPNSSPLNN